MSSVFTAISAAVAATAATVGTAAASVGTAFGMTAATTTAATTTAAVSTAAASTITLSQVLSAGSALAAIGQGFAASAAAKDQAAFAQVQGLQEEAQGAAKARDLSREYAELTGEQKVIQLANGLDIGVGTPVNVAQSTRRLAERNLDVTRQGADNRSAMSRLRSRGLMSEARSSVLGGFGRSAAIGADAFQLTG